jgi:acyl transferase domain-containing protein
VLLCGPESGLASVTGRLRSAGVPFRRVRARSAFHSPEVEEVSTRCERVLCRAEPRPPRIPIRSGSTGLPVTEEQARTAGFWTGQIAAPVLFGAALDGLFDGLPDDGPPPLLVEAGPGGALSALAARHPRGRRATILSALPPPRRGRDADRAAESDAYRGLLERVAAVSAR